MSAGKPLPMVTEKGTDAKAQLMIKIAEKAKVPIVENVPLARQLMKEADIGEYIPSSLFASVAGILHEIMRLKALNVASSLEALRSGTR